MTGLSYRKLFAASSLGAHFVQKTSADTKRRATRQDHRPDTAALVAKTVDHVAPNDGRAMDALEERRR